MTSKIKPGSPGSALHLSIIIPAHNEEAVIARCLGSLLDGLDTDAEILVCANGCTDRTIEVAGRFDRVRVLSVTTASKAAALNAGDRAAVGRIKVFVDADVVVTGRDVLKVAAQLENDLHLVASPGIFVDTRNASWAVRAYYSIWMKTPYVNQGMVGSGFYALSQAGRARFAEFPNIVGDDTYIRILFAPAERAAVTDATFTVFPPRTLDALVDIETRRKAGFDEICELLPAEVRTRDKSQSLGLVRIGLNPMVWPGLAVYGYVKVVSRLRYRARKRRGKHKTWSRDETSRCTT